MAGAGGPRYGRPVVSGRQAAHRFPILIVRGDLSTFHDTPGRQPAIHAGMPPDFFGRSDASRHAPRHAMYPRLERTPIALCR
ncbi:protein of unknown function [Paraburkholderia dioscoreae]|uniref:Uncharacterized protein n=1 Tax=Paraburkholderia dioscoreae TaxID=2604047 RepID=A0A5Q4ZP97_9BURK|nr:protein of unknown function [Paraburkholderia dioscoreae]